MSLPHMYPSHHSSSALRIPHFMAPPARVHSRSDNLPSPFLFLSIPFIAGTTPSRNSVSCFLQANAFFTFLNITQPLPSYWQCFKEYYLRETWARLSKMPNVHRLFAAELLHSLRSQVSICLWLTHCPTVPLFYCPAVPPHHHPTYCDITAISPTGISILLGGVITAMWGITLLATIPPQPSSQRKVESACYSIS